MSTMHNKGILSGFDRDEIEKRIAKIFTEESEQIILKDIHSLKQEVDRILNNVKLKSSDQTIAYNTKEKENMIAEAYLIVFKLREALLQESIDYRYYYTAPDGKTKVYHFTEKDILKYFHFDTNKLTLLDSKIRQAAEDSEYQRLVDRHMENLMKKVSSIQITSKNGHKTTRQLVSDDIIRKYGSKNSGLINKDSGGAQLFTQGHLYEAVDIAFSESIQNNKIDDYDYIEDLVYGKYLKYDSINGTKGGDNHITMTQIKSNSASFLKYNTIIDALGEISTMLDKATPSPQLKEKIKNLYISEVKYEDFDSCEKAVDDAVQKIVDLFNKS